jgi:hypothetical protein
MALSATERKRKQLERDREYLRKLPESTYPFLAKPYDAWLESEGDTSDINVPWELMGFESPSFDDNKGPEQYSIHPFGHQEDMDEIFAGYEGSVGRAEFMVIQLICAAEALSISINQYKRNQLAERLDSLEAEDLSDPDRRKTAFAESALIARLQDELQKNVRYTFPQWIVKGV